MNRKSPPSSGTAKPSEAAGSGSRGLFVLSAGFAVAAVAATYFAVLDPDPTATANTLRGLAAESSAATDDDRDDERGDDRASDETGMADELDVVPTPAVVLHHDADGAPGSAAAAAAADDEPPQPEMNVLEHVLLKTETVGGALEDLGVSGAAAAELIEAMSPAFDFRYARDGDRFTVMLGKADRRVESFEYMKSPVDIWIATRGAGGKLDVRKKSVETTTEIAQIGVSISRSLYTTIERVGEHPSLANFFANVFAWDLDFYIDTHPGDSLRIMVEKVMHDGKFLKYGRILAAEYVGKVGTFRGYWYSSPGGGGDYYDDEGRSLRKEFLKTPLKFVRITSKFTPKRMHPVLHTITSHLGVDYAAPTGTPIRSVAEGIVTFAGWKGPNGNLVVVKHKNDYVSAYAHLSRIGEGVKVGTRVTHERTIGYVGSTGYSTGPHLHFALRRAGKFINPLAMKMVPGEPLPETNRKAFLAATVARRGDLARIALLHPHVVDPSAGPGLED